MNKKYQVLRCGRLYDGVTQEWKSSQSILVEDHLIVEVGSNVSVPEGATVIDLTDWPGNTWNDRCPYAYGLF